MVYHGISLINQWRCLNSPTTGELSCGFSLQFLERWPLSLAQNMFPTKGRFKLVDRPIKKNKSSANPGNFQFHAPQILVQAEWSAASFRLSKVARCGMEAHWKDNQPAAIPWENLSQKNSRCNEGMLLLSANLELQAQAFANAFTNAPHIIYVLRTQICLYMCMHFSIMSIYKLSGPWGTCLKSDCCMFHICSHHRQSNLTFVHPAIKRNRISSIYGGLKKLGKSTN